MCLLTHSNFLVPMRLTFSFNPVFIILVISLFFVQCNKDESLKKIDSNFIGYISGFTSGVISNQSTIKIRLEEPYNNAKINEKVEENLFDFTPNIKGDAFWLDNQTIEFRPEENLPSGKLFDAKFYLSKLISVPKKLKTFEFRFQVLKQAVDIYFLGMEPLNKKDLKWQNINGNVLTYDYADSKELENTFEAMQNGNELFVRWQHTPDGKIHQFIIDSVQRSETRNQVILQWNGKELGFAKEGEKVFEVPPLGEFKVLDVKITQQPEQFITIYFSDPIASKQDLEGLIYLQSSTKLKILRENNAIHIYPATRQKGSVNLHVTDGIKNSMGYQLILPFEKQITFTSVKPAVELLGKGVIMPSTNGLIFPFKAVNLNAVNIKVIKVFEKNIAQFLQVNQFDGNREMKRVGRIVFKGEIPLKSDKPINYESWNPFSIDLSKLIKVETGSLYRVILSFNQHQSLYPCEEKIDKKTDYTFLGEDPEEASYDNPSDYYYYDDVDYYYNNHYVYKDRDNPCKPTYYMVTDRFISKNILASDMGIIAKSGFGNSMTIAITDIKTTNPISGVDVEVFNFQNHLIDKKSTDKDGFLRINLKNKPFLLIAKKGQQRGYLKLDDGSALSLSMFDIGGQKFKKGVKGFVFGERGVWQPGDSIFLSFILEDKNKVIPKNHPVIMELYTPQNQLYERKIKTTSLNGFYDFRTTTTKDAPTGNWRAKVKLGSSVFEKVLKIETIKPNRLKIDLDFHKPFLSDNKKSKGSLEVKWLHGAIARNLKADVELKLTKGSTVFKQFNEYTFDDPSKEFSSEENIIFNGKLDANGKAVIIPDFQVQKNAPGMLNAHFRIRAFEKGGDFSVNRMSIPYSPYRSYVGIKVPKGNGWNGALYSNETNLIPIVTVNENGKLIDIKNLKIEIYDVYWRWWWERSDQDNLSRYVANRNKNLIKTATISTKNGKAMFALNLDGDYYGRKFIKVIDPETGHSTGQAFYVTYKGWWDNGGENPGGAEMLTFSTDKKIYQIGEKIKVNIPSSKQGRTLVSIESGSKILKTFWLSMEDGQTNFEIEATEEMTPNVFFNLTLIQPHGNVKNDLPIRLYGIQGVSVENKESHLNPVITMPNILKPEKKFTVSVSEKTGKKMTYVLAVVDDGLLDLTRFKTPNPWQHFYAKEALSIKTWDMYKYVIGAFTGKMSGLLALGGDEYLNKSAGAKANRFKPVVKFIGPFELSTKGYNKHSINMPNYVGSVRIMVIAKSGSSYGSADKTTVVKMPLMVLATLPRVVGPGEKVALPVTVFAMDKKVKDVSVTIEINDFLLNKEQKSKTIHFSQVGDQVVNFNLNVAKKLGIAKVKIIAKSGSKKAVYNIELDVRAPNPRITDVTGAFIEPGETWKNNYTPIGMSGTNKGIVEVSTIPSLKLEERLQYLITYPHGCIEQTTSSVFPQLYLTNLLELNPEEENKIENNVKSAINKMRSFQIASGGLSYWPGKQNTINEWGTNYAGHFMLEAKAKGYSLPPGFLNKWIVFQQQRANSWTADAGNSYNSNQLTQAYRLYTLALAKKPVLGAMNRLKSTKNLSLQAKWRLAAAYYLIGKKRVAENLVANLSNDIKPYRELSYSFGSDVRDKAMILETLTMLQQKSKAKEVLDELANNLSSNRWYSTQTTAYSLLAIAKFIGDTNGSEKNISYQYILNGKDKNINQDAAISQINLKIKEKNSGAISIKNTGNKTLFIKQQLEGIPDVSDKSNAENNLKIAVKYLSLDGKEINPAKIDQGTDFIAEVQIKHPGIRGNYKEVSLTHIFPSGWEIRNLRMDGVEIDKKADLPTYQDIRDDRVLTYFDLKRGEQKTFRVLLNASYLGDFYLPTVICEAMYDNKISARKAGRWVKVVMPGSKRK